MNQTAQGRAFIFASSSRFQHDFLNLPRTVFIRRLLREATLDGHDQGVFETWNTEEERSPRPDLAKDVDCPLGLMFRPLKEGIQGSIGPR